MQGGMLSVGRKKEKGKKIQLISSTLRNVQEIPRFYWRKSPVKCATCSKLCVSFCVDVVCSIMLLWKSNKVAKVYMWSEEVKNVLEYKMIYKLN